MLKRNEPASPFHRGEQAVQSRAGVRDAVEMMGKRIIRDAMPDQHREFFTKLPLLFVGSIDRDRRPWASVLVGAPGFAHTPDSRTLEIAAPTGFGDPAASNLVAGAPVGVLGIQLETRRRNRVNGTLTRADASGLTIDVGQSFGNCPKYIQARTPRFVAAPETVRLPRVVHLEGSVLSREALALIHRADTFFIASASVSAGGSDPVEGADISHRGGRPGFVRALEQGDRSVLVWPEFVGNYMFNTLGNLHSHPHGGLLFIDFETGDVLSLTGNAEIVWNGPEVVALGVPHLVRLLVSNGVRIENAVPLRWSPAEFARELADRLSLAPGR